VYLAINSNSVFLLPWRATSLLHHTRFCHRGPQAHVPVLWRLELPREDKDEAYLGDVIHSVIVKNNGISDILTFDEKDDFKQILDLTVLHPKDVKI
jgi:hypothetical protein